MDRSKPKTAPKNNGALIFQGPDDWQILQRQTDGAAEVRLSGTWEHAGATTDPVVKVRAVLEDTGEPIVLWTNAEMGAGCRWSFRLRLPEGGPYRIETCLSIAEQPQVEWSVRGDMIHHVGVGDVFAIAGQSNSAGYGKDPVLDPPEVGIHLLANDGRWRLAAHPFNDSTGTVHPANKEGGNPGHSPWLSFAKRMRRETGVPIGFVESALGGSPLSEWNPEESGKLYRNLMDILATLREEGADPSTPGARLLVGVLWYQGCSDTEVGLCDTYLERFGRFVAHLREDLGYPGLPFLTVQIGRFTTKTDAAGDARWGKVREAQRQAAHVIPGIAVIPAIDLPLSDAIHISSSGNLVLGERAAKAVLGSFYGIGNDFRPPEAASAVQLGEREVRIHFAHVPERLYDYEGPPENSPFCVETAEGALLVPVAVAYPDRTDVRLTFDRDLGPGCRVHGAYRQNPLPFIPFDVSTRLPMLTFYGLPVERQG